MRINLAIERSYTFILIFILQACFVGCALAEDSEHPNFNGVWQVTEYDEIKRPDETGQYTAEILERIKFYKEHFDTVKESSSIFCDNPGIPWIMTARARTYPREIYQTEDRIFYMLEYMDIYRQIHINKKAVPKGFFGSKMGYSIAHWEGAELVVETTKLTSLSEVGNLHRSDEARVIERWRLADHPKYGETIEVELKVIDPVVYKEPAFGRALLMRAPEGTEVGEYNCPGTLWEEFVNGRLEDV